MYPQAWHLNSPNASFFFTSRSWEFIYRLKFVVNGGWEWGGERSWYLAVSLMKRWSLFPLLVFALGYVTCFGRRDMSKVMQQRLEKYLCIGAGSLSGLAEAPSMWETRTGSWERDKLHEVTTVFKCKGMDDSRWCFQATDNLRWQYDDHNHSHKIRPKPTLRNVVYVPKAVYVCYLI